MIQQETSAKRLCCSDAPPARFQGLPGCVAGRAARWSLARSSPGQFAGLESINVLILWWARPVAAGPEMEPQVDSPVAYLASSIVLRSWSVLPSVGPAAFGQRAGWSRVHAAPEQPPWQKMVACHSIGASRQSASTCCAVGQRKDAACNSERDSHQSASTCCAAVGWQVGEDALHWHYPKGHSPSESRWT